MRTAVALAGVALVLGAGMSAVGADETSRGLLERVGASAVRFGREFQGVVASERYVQTIRPWPGSPPARPALTEGAVLARRELYSDLLLVFDAEGPWQLYRDVIEVDGRPVGDRSSRLEALFLAPGMRTRDRLRRMTGESARYNLGDITRTLNIPTFPLIVVHPLQQQRFRIRIGGAVQHAGVTVRELTFVERQRPTLVRSTDGRNVPLQGTLLVDETTGELVHARLEPQLEQVHSHIEVWFDHVASLTRRVPVAMWEWYQVDGPIRDGHAGGDGFREAYVEGLARYDNFRRYTVETNERIAPPR